MEFKELEEQILESISSLSLDDATPEVLPKFKLKVLQLFETFNVRFGVMVVGPAGGGKSACYKVLQHALTALHAKGSPDERFQEVKLKSLNPKSISMGELYGEENPDTMEWTDGLASRVIRKFAGEDGERRSWTVFDGPVDALWIENMNTVLDDNMTLCLANGERIKLRQQMRMLFEVQDLAAAAPSTVSRCGMVYMTPSELGWRPYKTQWMKTYMTKRFSEEI
jgi:dynein heavy chain